jgi:hypothetical protein
MLITSKAYVFFESLIKELSNNKDSIRTGMIDKILDGVVDPKELIDKIIEFSGRNPKVKEKIEDYVCCLVRRREKFEEKINAGIDLFKLLKIPRSDLVKNRDSLKKLDSFNISKMSELSKVQNSLNK